MFSDYVMSGVSAERNEIHLEVPVGLFAEVLKSAASAHSFRVRDYSLQTTRTSSEATFKAFAGIEHILESIIIFIWTQVHAIFVKGTVYLNNI